MERTILTAQGAEGADNTAVATTVRGPATTVHLEAYPERIAPNGHQATIVALVADDAGWNVANDTAVAFQTRLGTLDPPVGTTVNGVATTTLTSGSTTGIVQVQATAGSASDMIELEISAAPAYTLTLTAGTDQLPPDGASTTLLTACVYDKYGDPAPDGTPVVFGVEGDEAEGGEPRMGTVEGREVYMATASGGVATATFRSGMTSGLATVRAVIPIGGSIAGDEGTESECWAKTTDTPT